ncbi:MAG: ABC transporter ATP-binding protein [Gemmatimonadota bacterium]|nr:ABC transporter ATP-binding protein [Gemmatimonadota bacterium]
MTDLPLRTSDGQALHLDRLSVRFGDGPGLVDLSLSVAAGERIVVLGPSGAGKTTLLRAVAGLARVDSGRVLVGAADVTRLPPERRDVVYLHQSPVLFSHLSVAENVAFPLRVRGQRGQDVQARVRTALTAMRLEDFGARAIHTLSGGQRHRVALARAIAARPAALLLDEPLSALDPTLRDEVREAVVAAQEEYGPAMMLVTHDLDDAGLLADRVAVLLDGRIAQVSTPAELFAHPATLAVARFLGLYQEVPGVIRADGEVECALGVLQATALRNTLPALTPVIVAVRAEGLRVGPSREQSVAGRIVGFRQRARGTTAVVRLANGGGELGVELEAALASSDTLPNIGDAVWLSLAPRSALVFPASA